MIGLCSWDSLLDASEQSPYAYAMLRSFNKGATYYMKKPVETRSRKNLWQYVFLNRRDKQLQKIGQKGSIQVESLGKNESDVDAGSVLISSGNHDY